MTPLLLRILFIGNSLTAGHDLPAIVEALARADDGVRIETRAVAFPGHSLEDHWNRPEARQAIASRAWDVVVLQQGPSALPDSRRLLREYTRRFDREIRKAGARTALYMVWPSAARSFDFDAVEASWRIAAGDVNGLLLPVGSAWRAAWKRDPALALYGPDRFHPSPAGTLLAALVIYQQVTGRPAAALPSPFSSIDPAVVSVLRDAAAEACGRISPSPPPAGRTAARTPCCRRFPSSSPPSSAR
jgi:hypothetical protein